MKLISTFLKDMKLSLRSYYLYIEIIMALLIIAVLLFVIPENFSTDYKLMVHLDIEDAVIIQMAEQLQADDAEMSELRELLEAKANGTGMTESSQDADELQQMILMDSEQELRDALTEERNSVGLIVSMDDGKSRLKLEFVLQGYESEQMRNLLKAQFSAPFMAMMPGYVDQTEVTVLDDAAEKLPDRINMLPVMIVLNSALVGLFVISAYIFMDKEEGTIRALTVTPLTIREYLLSKLGIMVLTGTVTGSLTVLAVAHDYVHYQHFLVLIIVFTLFASTLGLLIGSLYNTLTKSLGSLYTVIMLLALASFSYFMPSFSPLAVKLLPTYPMLYAMREVLLEKPDLGYIYTWVGVFALASVLLFFLAEWRYRKSITV